MNLIDIDAKITEAIFEPLKKGEEIRRTGQGPNPYIAGSLFHCLCAYGWVKEDLRIGLMKNDPKYAESQAVHGQGLDKVSNQ